MVKNDIVVIDATLPLSTRKMPNKPKLKRPVIIRNCQTRQKRNSRRGKRRLR